MKGRVGGEEEEEGVRQVVSIDINIRVIRQQRTALSLRSFLEGIRSFVGDVSI